MPKTPKDIVIIAAAEFEICAAREVLQKLHHKVDFFCCGIGALDAVASATSWLYIEHLRQHLDTCDMILYIGTCGLFANFAQPLNFTAVVSSWLPLDERMGLSYRVPGTLSSYQLPSTLALPKAHVISSQNISLSGEGVFGNHVTLENLELYSVVKVLQSYHEKLHVLLTTTNAVGPDA